VIFLAFSTEMRQLTRGNEIAIHEATQQRERESLAGVIRPNNSTDGSFSVAVKLFQEVIRESF